MIVTVRLKTIARLLAWGVIAFGLLNVGLLAVRFGTGHGRLLGLSYLFDVSKEANVPTWYSTFLLLVAAALLWVVSTVEREHGHLIGWRVLSAAFLYMSIDETATLHETGSGALAVLLHSETLAEYGGVIPDVILAVVILLASLPLLRSLPRAVRGLFILAGLLYVGGAAGVEALERAWAFSRGADGLFYGSMLVVEELMEMAGVVVFIRALAYYLSTRGKSIELRLVYRP